MSIFTKVDPKVIRVLRKYSRSHYTARYFISAEINDSYILRAEKATPTSEVLQYNLIKKSDEGCAEGNILATHYADICAKILDALPNKTYHIDNYVVLPKNEQKTPVYRHYTNDQWELSPITKVLKVKIFPFRGTTVHKSKAKFAVEEFLKSSSGTTKNTRVNVDLEHDDLQEDYDPDGTILGKLLMIIEGRYSRYIMDNEVGIPTTKEEGEVLSLEDYKSAKREHYFTLPPTSVRDILNCSGFTGIIPFIGYDVTEITETNDQDGYGLIMETDAATGETRYRTNNHVDIEITDDWFKIVAALRGIKESYIHVPIIVYDDNGEVCGIIDVDILTDESHNTTSLIRVVYDQHLSLDLLEFPDWIKEISGKDIDVALSDYRREHSSTGVLKQLNIKI